MQQPNVRIITEVQLYRAGFSQYKTLAEKLSVLFRMLETQVCLVSPASYMHNCVSRKYVVSTVLYILLSVLYVHFYSDMFFESFICAYFVCFTLGFVRK